ncbi:ankyrin [Aaosphaeria arxii CBS 175.79]|uniref:Ankyrin n=1 Tax=Aaosphaeria arxii CBS 175.79 TaxID=1450172 RepID=A0A6A5YB97_9PLEO|nr:ankyrin [Aaosphaeria arxii CBS 175.79]KAF2021874.1 ankyrin [Aaosphaeria arxii CBS 175.79]
MPKVMVAQLIQRKTYMHNGRNRSICLSIRRAEDLLATVSLDKERTALGKCAQVLATTASHTLYFFDIIKHLKVADKADAYPEETPLENALIAATCMHQVSTVKTLVKMGAKSTAMTRFFGDAMTAAARFGFHDILVHFLDHSSITPSPIRFLTHATALEAACVAGNEQAVSMLLRRTPLHRPQLWFDTAAQSAVRAKDEPIALMILHNRQPHIDEKEPMFWVNLLRTASKTACNTVIEFIFKSSKTDFDEEHIALSIEDASQCGHVSTVQLLLTRSPSRMKLTGAAFLAAFHGRKEIVNLLIANLGDSEECIVADTLAGAALNGHVDLIRHVMRRVTGKTDSIPNFGGSKLMIYVYAINSWLDLRVGRRQWKPSLPSATSDQSLWEACEEGRIGEVRKLISSARKRRMSALCSAAARRRHPGLLLYLSQFVPPWVLPATALESESRAIFEVYFSLGWNVNAPLSRITPPLLGYVLDDEFLVQWLLDHGADPNTRCDWDFTPMSRAVSVASLPVLRLLFERTESIRPGQLIHFVLDRKEPDVKDIIDLLLDLGASLHAIQYQDDPASWAEMKYLGLGTPLHGAIQLGRKDLVSYLIKKGADRMIKDSLGRTAIALAETCGCEEIIQLVGDDQTKPSSR